MEGNGEHKPHKLTISWNPATSEIQISCESGMAVARGLLQAVHTYEAVSCERPEVQEVVLTSRLPDLDVRVAMNCDVHAARGVIALALEFYKSTWANLLNMHFLQQAQGRVHVPGARRASSGLA